jgi:hypothetical protein
MSNRRFALIRMPFSSLGGSGEHILRKITLNRVKPDQCPEH